MKIRDDNFCTTEFLGIKEAGLFAIGDEYYVKLAYNCDLASGRAVNAVHLGDGTLRCIDLYATVRSLSECTLAVVKE